MPFFRARSSAKINLSLDILDRLPNGYHTLRSLVHPIGLWDELELKFHKESHIVFECNNQELRGEGNLCVRAFKAWREAVEFDSGAAIRLKKHIPHGAGLGGGSGNAAAVLLLAATQGAHPTQPQQLLEIAAKLGADVPLFLLDSPVLMEGIGERLSPVPALEGWVLLVKPREGFATPAIYRAWDEANQQSQSATEALLPAWTSGSLKEVAFLMSNDLERAARLLSPLPERCVELLREAGSLGAMMSGSGSACFGLFEGEEEARRGQARVEEAMAKDVLLVGATTFAVPLSKRGVELL